MPLLATYPLNILKQPQTTTTNSLILKQQNQSKLNNLTTNNHLINKLNNNIKDLKKTNKSFDSNLLLFSKVVHLRNIPSDMTELELVCFNLIFDKI